MNRKDGLAWKPGRLHRSRWSRRPRDFHAIAPLKGRSKKSDTHSYIQLLKINRGVMLSTTPPYQRPVIRPPSKSPQLLYSHTYSPAPKSVTGRGRSLLPIVFALKAVFQASLAQESGARQRPSNQRISQSVGAPAERLRLCGPHFPGYSCGIAGGRELAGEFCYTMGTPRVSRGTTYA